MKLYIKLHSKLDSFNLNVKETVNGDRVTAIYGHSGCGKTTLLRCLSGLEKNVNGIIQFNDSVWLDTEKGINLPTEQRRIGYVFQEPSLFPHLSVVQNIEYGLKRTLKWLSPNKLVFNLNDVAGFLGIESLLRKKSTELSGGERQRVALARAIMSHPQLLMMDEPLSALDSKSKLSILPYFEELSEFLKIPILYVSHSEYEVARLADNILILENGRVVQKGKLLDMLSSLDSPLAQLDDCFSIIDGTVADIESGYGLSQFEFGESQIRISSKSLIKGQSLKLRVFAKDISLCLEPPKNSSILNILPCTVDEVLPLVDEAQCLLRLKIDNNFLIARISEFSREQLDIKKGTNAFAQIKAVAIVK